MTDPAARPSTVGRPPRADLLLMGIGVLAVSTSGPLMAAVAAPALAVALWRNVLALAAIWPAALATRRTELAGLSRRERAVGRGRRCAAGPALRDLGAEPALHLGRVGHRDRGDPAGLGGAARPGDGARRAAPGLAGHRDLAGRRRRADRGRLLAGRRGADRRPARAARRASSARSTRWPVPRCAARSAPRRTRRSATRRPPSPCSSPASSAVSSSAASAAPPGCSCSP